MLTNHLRTAWRHLHRERAFSAVNILGLALGFAACILIVLFVADEFSYDRYNEKADRIFRIVSDIHINGGTVNNTATPRPMAAALVKDFPAIETAVRIRPLRKDILVRSAAGTFIESNVVFADPTLFDVFTLPMIAGNPHTALVAPTSLVLSETAAKKYFGSTDVLGRTLRTDDDTTDNTITGIIRDMPRQSHFHLHLIKSMNALDQHFRQSWINLHSATYVLTRPGTTTLDVDRMLAATADRYITPQIKQQLHNSAADMTKHGDYFRYYSMPLTRIHLYSNVGLEFEPNGNIRYVYIFLLIAILILLTACINFTNLSTAQGARRAREVGVRKVLGSGRRQLIGQFLAESFLTSFIAMLLALVLTLVLLPWFDQLSGKQVSPAFLLSPWTVPILLLATTLVGLSSGSYPAFFLSGFQPIKVLQGNRGNRRLRTRRGVSKQPRQSSLTAGFRAGWLRNGLLVFQFSIAIMLIIGTMVIYSQLYYIRHKQLGYTREQVLTVKNTRFLGSKVRAFADAARKLPGVVSATVSGFLPDQKTVLRGFFKDQSGTVTSTVLLGDCQVDADYIPTLDMKMVAGRNFSPLMPTDSGCVLINETAARTLGYAHPIGEMVYTGPDPLTGYRILGVVKDFNTASLRDPIDPLVFRLDPDRGAVSFRIDTRNIPALLAGIRRQYDAMAKKAGDPFVYSFLDDDFNNLYQSDQRTGRLFISFAVLAIFIACLGMFGLVTYATELRTKEIGIRRVLGARLTDLILLLSKDYGLAIAISTLIAIPTGAWVMHNWLHEFAYRTSLQPWIFAAAPLCAIGIALLIVGTKASQAARVNPAKSLRTD